MAAQLVLLVVLVGAFYMLLIRPQRRRLRDHENLVGGLVPGDSVVTIGGIVGSVRAIEDDHMLLEIADGVVIRVVKQAIGRKVLPPQAQDEPEIESAGLEGTSGTDDTG
jgi:preprotein translocase subunit YajC